jgi:large subunit ribosomal protein L17
MPKLFGELRDRYLKRPGGYTRILKIEPEKEDQAASAILELVDGPKDIRFNMTAKTIALERANGINLRDMTLKNVEKVTKFRPGGKLELEKAVKMFQQREVDEERRLYGQHQEKVYPPRMNPKQKGNMY